MKHDVEREQSIQEIERTDWEQDCKLLVDPAALCWIDHYEGSGHWQLEIAYGPRLQREQAPEGAPVRKTASWRTSCIHDFIRFQLDWTVTEVWLPICLYVLYLALTASLLKRAVA